jgi:hypothetical protein
MWLVSNTEYHGVAQMQHLRLYELASEESDRRGLAVLHAVRKGVK